MTAQAAATSGVDQERSTARTTDEGEGSTTSPYLCVKYDGDDARQRKHAATWVGYRIVTRDASRLQSTCIHCGQPIRRAHLRSAQWRAVST